jgi:hypothetical protein
MHFLTNGQIWFLLISVVVLVFAKILLTAAVRFGDQVEIPITPTKEQVEAFKKTWAEADKLGLTGQRSAAGLTAVYALLKEKK